MGNSSGDDFSSGVWRPAGANSEVTDDAIAGPVYVAPGVQHSDWSVATGSMYWHPDAALDAFGNGFAATARVLTDAGLLA